MSNRKKHTLPIRAEHRRTVYVWAAILEALRAAEVAIPRGGYVTVDYTELVVSDPNMTPEWLAALAAVVS